MNSIWIQKLLKIQRKNARNVSRLELIWSLATECQFVSEYNQSQIEPEILFRIYTVYRSLTKFFLFYSCKNEIEISLFHHIHNNEYKLRVGKLKTNETDRSHWRDWSERANKWIEQIEDEMKNGTKHLSVVRMKKRNKMKTHTNPIIVDKMRRFVIIIRLQNVCFHINVVVFILLLLFNLIHCSGTGSLKLCRCGGKKNKFAFGTVYIYTYILNNFGVCNTFLLRTYS